MSETPVPLTVDADRCIGSGMCELLEEAVFVLDEDTNIAAVRPGSSVTPDRALTIIDRCPAGAISIDESPSSEE